MLTSFLSNELLVGISTTGEVVDFVGDAWVFNDVIVQNSDKVDLGRGLIVAWVGCFCLAVLASMVCSYFKILVILALKRKRRAEFNMTQMYQTCLDLLMYE